MSTVTDWVTFVTVRGLFRGCLLVQPERCQLGSAQIV